MRHLLNITVVFILLFSCEHPESKIFERNQNSSDNLNTPEIKNRPSPVYSLNEDLINDEIPTENIEQIPIPTIPIESAKNVLTMKVQNGVRYVWIEINGIKLKFIFDTGASSICSSPAEATVLFRQGTLTEEDFIGSEYFQDATGGISEGVKINLREVKIGEVILENIE